MSPERKQRIKQIAEPVRQIGQVLGVAACVYLSGDNNQASNQNTEILTRIETKLDNEIKRVDRVEKMADRHEDRDQASNTAQWKAIRELGDKLNSHIINPNIHTNQP